jgi:outer membrane protein assembly factor BamA
LETSPEQIIFDVPGVRQVTRQDVQQDITINNAAGFQFTMPLPENNGIRSTVSAGLNYKSYQLTSSKTNNFRFSEFTVDPNGKPNPPVISEVSSPVPLTDRLFDYLPVSLRYDGSAQDAHGVTAFGAGLTANAWYSGSLTNLHNVTGSKKSSGHWVTINPTITRDIYFPRNWTLSLHGEAQWSSEPLISNEQFGSGGVNSVRGYHEGEVFGDKGWRVDCELKTPPHVAGFAYGKTPLTLRGSVFTDYSEVYLMDPQGRAGTIPLWSAGIGAVASVGTHWEAHLIFAVPFDRTLSTESMQPRFSFSLIGQF